MEIARRIMAWLRAVVLGAELRAALERHELAAARLDRAVREVLRR